MDELQISGRRFISSRRLAKEHGYHSDYLGQLIRGGKVVGQKVGRAWYIDAASFDVYLGKEAPVASNVAVVEPEVAPVTSVVVQTVEDVATQTAEDAAEKEVGVVAEEQEAIQEASVQKIHITTAPAPTRRVTPAPVAPVAPSGLRYYADDAPLIPPVAEKHNAPLFVARVNTSSAVVAEEDTAAEPRILAREAVRPTWRARHTAGILALGSIALVGAAIVSNFLQVQIQTDGQTANVTYSFDFPYPASFAGSVK